MIEGSEKSEDLKRIKDESISEFKSKLNSEQHKLEWLLAKAYFMYLDNRGIKNPKLDKYDFQPDAIKEDLSKPEDDGSMIAKRAIKHWQEQALHKSDFNDELIKLFQDKSFLNALSPQDLSKLGIDDNILAKLKALQVQHSFVTINNRCYMLGPRVGSGGTASPHYAVDEQNNPSVVKSEPRAGHLAHDNGVTIYANILRQVYGNNAAITTRSMQREFAKAAYPKEKFSEKLYTAMPFVEGHSLDPDDEHYQNLSLDEKNHLAIACCKALDELHKMGIAHTDIKPDNFLWRKDQNNNFQVIIIDFALALPMNAPMPQAYKQHGGGYAPVREWSKQQTPDASFDTFSMGVSLRMLGFNKQIYAGLINEDKGQRATLNDAVGSLEICFITGPDSAFSKQFLQEETERLAAQAPATQKPQPAAKESSQPTPARPEATTFSGKEKKPKLTKEEKEQQKMQQKMEKLQQEYKKHKNPKTP